VSDARQAHRVGDLVDEVAQGQRLVVDDVVFRAGRRALERRRERRGEIVRRRHALQRARASG
jgi:hypothetical protein